MIKLRKAIASIGALAIMATTLIAFSAVNVNAAGEGLSLKVTYDSDTKAGSNIYVTGTLSGFDESLYVSAMDFNIECNNANVITYLDYANATAVCSGFLTGYDSITTTKVKNTSKNKFLQLSFANTNNTPVLMKNGDFVTWTIPIKADIDTTFELLLNDFTLILMEDLEDSETENRFTDSNTTVTKDSVEQVVDEPTSAWVAAERVGSSYTGDEGFTSDGTTVAYKATLNAANRQDKLTWAAKVDGVGKGVSVDTPVTVGGSGDVLFGLIISGLNNEVVSDVYAGWGELSGSANSPWKE